MEQNTSHEQKMPRSVRWAWLCLLILAAATRLLGLAATPLSPSEAGRALAAMDAAQRGLWPASADSTLLLKAQALFFAVLGPSEPAARLLPALAGIALVAIPMMWRRQLGENGALVAAGLLLVSPLGLLSARSVDGVAIATMGSALVLTVLLRALTGSGEGRGENTLLTIGLVLGLTGGPAAFSVLLAAVAPVWIVRRSRPETRLPKTWRRALLTAVGISLAISVALGLHWSGWAGIADGLAAWFGGWRRATSPRTSTLGLLLLYEPLLLIAAAAGLGFFALTDQRRDAHTTALVAWSGCALLLALLRPGDAPLVLTTVILPLALLGGLAGERLWGAIPSDARGWAGLHTLTSALFWTPGLFAVAQHAGNLAASNQIAVIALGLVVLLSLQGLLFVIFMMYVPAGVLWRSALTSVGAICLLLQLSFSSGLVYARPHPALEPAIEVAGSRDLAHLSQAVAQLAVTHGARKDSLTIALIDQDPDLANVVRWTLRDYGGLRQVAGWPADDVDLVIGPDTARAPDTSSPSRTGMRFVATTKASTQPPACRQWSPLECRDVVKWYLYRSAPELPTPTYAYLWQSSQDAD